MVDITKLRKTASTTQKLTEQKNELIDPVHDITDASIMRTATTIQKNSTANLLLTMERHKTLIKFAQEPLEKMRLIGYSDKTSQFYERFISIQNMMEGFNARFILPEVPSTVKLVQEFQESSAVEIITRYQTQAGKIQRSMEAMHTPWLDVQKTLQSVTSFTKIQGIGRMLERMPAFSDIVCEALRVDLGDWRQKIDWPEAVLTNLDEREAFYTGLGFDSSISDFPSQAFQEITKIAGLGGNPPPLISAYCELLPDVGGGIEEEGFALNKEAYDWLQRLETNLRHFIDGRMTDAFGADWPNHQLPNGLCDLWVNRSKTSINAGREPLRLICYADFSDYVRVICKRDNWNQVFSHYFCRETSVRESFQRLYPIRNDTMHARFITQDDLILMYVEAGRLIKAISE